MSLYGWGCTNRIVCEAINATVTEKACVCQLLNMGRSEWHTVEQLPYKSLTFEMLRWARLPSPSLYRGWTEERLRAGSGWHREHGTTTHLPGRRGSRERQRTLPARFLTCWSLLRPCLLLRSRQNGAAQRRPEKHKEFYHKVLLYVLHWLTWFPSYLSSARLLIHPFRLMNYTTKKIGALGLCYWTCKTVKIPFLTGSN